MNRDEAILTLRGLFAGFDEDPVEHIKPMITDFGGKPHLRVADGLMTAKEVVAVAVLMGYVDSEGAKHE